HRDQEPVPERGLIRREPGVRSQESGEAASDSDSRLLAPDSSANGGPSMAVSAAPARRGFRIGTATRNQILGLLFVAPWLIGFLAFTIYPILASLYYSFTLYDVINAPQWIGLQNYTFLLTQDPQFPTVLFNTVYLVALGLPTSMAVAFLLAGLLNNNI